MKKIIVYTLGLALLFFVGSFIYFFFAGEIKNTLQFDESRFVQIQKFIKQGKVESLSQAKLQLNLIAEDYKPDSTLLLKEELNATALSNAKNALSKKWYGACQNYLELVDQDYHPEEVQTINDKLIASLNNDSYDKAKKYIKERNLDKAKTYYSKIDTTYNSRKLESLSKKLYELENEIIIEETIALMNEKEFDDALDKLEELDEGFDPKTEEELKEEIKLKTELEDLLDDEGAIIVFVDYVKNEMNDPNSFEHVKTEISEKGKFLQVNMKYRENNTYGAKVMKTIEAKLHRDGSVKKVF